VLHRVACRRRARRLTQRWEASLWLTGKQLYLGGFESEEDAAHAYDLAALACKGRGVPTNFPSSTYRAELAVVAAYSQVPPFVSDSGLYCV